MERLSKRESILLSYNPQRSSTNPSTPNRNSDVDFHDVFGGPPRRSSIHDMRCSIGELQMKDEAPSCPSPRVREKPVFGQDNSNRRRYSKDNFFDDIFGGDESPSCTPRKHERDPFSRISSPAPSLHPGPDSFPTSPLPPTLSLPTFGSPTRSLRKNKKDGISSGLSSSDSPATFPSRFSSQATQGKQETYGQSLLSQEFSDLSMSGKADKGSDSAGQFHFSIYKWASKGIPLVMPLRAVRNSRTKEKVKLERCSSAKDWIVSESTGSSLRRNIIQDGSTTFTSLKSEADSRQFVKEIASVKLHLETLSSLQNDIKDVSVSEIGLSGKMKGDSENANETHKPKSKPLHSLFSESDDKQDYDGNTKRVTGKESKTKKSSAICNVSINPKKQEEKTAALKGVEVSKASSQGSLSLDDNMGNGQVKGKVKEFVRIFNQETLTKPRIDTKSRIQVEDNPERSQKEDSAIETTTISVNNSSRQDVISASAIPDSTVAVGDKDGFFHGNFLVKELAQDESEVLQTQDNQEIKVIEDKIRQWSNGKEGNIRSLLSTLQYVLWPESGWKPVPLVDIIEGNAVKRAYQRALLCLHPDKLQQKGAASDNKYIAEKVYDILQEAWTHFNVLGAL